MSISFVQGTGGAVELGPIGFVGGSATETVSAAMPGNSTASNTIIAWCFVKSDGSGAGSSSERLRWPSARFIQLPGDVASPVARQIFSCWSACTVFVRRGGSSTPMHAGAMARLPTVS
jgi:hypothetical protein